MARAVKKNQPEETRGIGHNSAAEEEQNRVTYLSILSQYDMALAAVEEARAPLKAAQKRVSSIVGLAKSAGVPKWRLQARYEEMQRPAHENADNMAAEARERRWAGIVSPKQTDIEDRARMAEEPRDAMDWQSTGYRAGVLGRAAVLPEGIPTRFTQDFLQGHEDGRKSYMLTLAKNSPKPKGSKAEEIAADAEALLKADAERDEQAEIEAAAKKLKADPAFMAKGAPDEGFEATPEELAAQSTRKAVQEARDAADEGPVL